MLTLSLKCRNSLGRLVASSSYETSLGILADQKFMSRKCNIVAENTTTTLVCTNSSIQTTKIFPS